MSREPRIVSVVTPSYNQAPFIAHTLKSVIEQAGPFFLDYIIVDGASTDDSVRVIKEYEKRVAQSSNIAVVRGIPFYKASPETPWISCRGISYRWLSEPDKGQSHAVNKGFSMAVGDIYAFLNSDDTYFPKALAKIAEIDWGGTEFAYGKGMWISKSGRHLLPYPTFSPNKYNFFFQCTLCQPAVFWKKQAFEALGGFSANYNLAFDFEYWMRALSRKMRFKYVRSYLAASRMYSQNKTLAQRDRQSREVSVLKKQYYAQPFTVTESLRIRAASLFVNRPTVRVVAKLHELLACDSWKP